MTLRVALLGATSLVGPRLLATLREAGWDVIALSRQMQGRPASRGDVAEGCPPAQGGGALSPQVAACEMRDGVLWSAVSDVQPEVPVWICLAPIWTLPEYFDHMLRCGVRRVIALSSTSGWTKRHARSTQERDTAAAIRQGEERLAKWAAQRDVEWVVLRTTLIHGEGRDRNVSDIARWLRRWRVFPLVGGGSGLRQPVHLRDVAKACLTLCSAPRLPCDGFNLVGGETLSYRDMVKRIAEACGVRFLFLPVPVCLARFAIRVLARLPRYRHLTAEMADRMNVDLVFDPAPLWDTLGLAGGAFDPSDSMSRAQDG